LQITICRKTNGFGAHIRKDSLTVPPALRRGISSFIVVVFATAPNCNCCDNNQCPLKKCKSMFHVDQVSKIKKLLSGIHFQTTFSRKSSAHFILEM
jgi:hypothetical protein